MVTILAAIVGVFLLMVVWISIDQLASRQLGERDSSCHGVGGDCRCGKHAGKACEIDATQDRPACAKSHHEAPSS